MDNVNDKGAEGTEISKTVETPSTVPTSEKTTASRSYEALKARRAAAREIERQKPRKRPGTPEATANRIKALDRAHAALREKLKHYLEG